MKFDKQTIYDEYHSASRWSDSQGFDLNAALGTVLKFSFVIIGVGIVFIGIWWAWLILDGIYEILKQPANFKTTFEQWQTILGGAQLDIVIDQTRIYAAPFLAVLVLCGGYAILFWLTLRLISLGTKIMTMSFKKDA